nr:MAG TPA: hypothetical protein [Caudoviricetes sp.]
MHTYSVWWSVSDTYIYIIGGSCNPRLYSTGCPGFYIVLGAGEALAKSCKICCNKRAEAGKRLAVFAAALHVGSVG